MSRRALSARKLTLLLAALTAAGPLALSIYVPAVPLARADFGVSVADASRTVSAPLIAFALGLFCYGPLSDYFGRRSVIVGGLLIYVVGATLAYFSKSIDALTTGRFVCALGSGAGVTIARAILGDLYERERMIRQLATLTMVIVVANAMSPFVGGLLAEFFGWRAVFLFLITLGVASLISALLWLPETRKGDTSSGVAHIGRAIGSLVRQSRFMGYAFQSGVVYAAFFVFVALIPHVMRHLGHSATEYGLWYVTISGGYFLGNWVVSRHTLRIGTPRLLQWGVLIQAVGAALGWLAAISGLWHPFWIFMPWGIMGFGQGFILPTLTAGAVALSPRYAGVASGLLGAIQQILGALAVQLMAGAATDTPIPTTTFVAAATAGAWFVLQLPLFARRWVSATR